jgi:hypothetical protein
MSKRGVARQIPLVCSWLVLAAVAGAAPYSSWVTFGGLPVPGAVVTVTQGNQKFTAVTNDQGVYSFPNLPDGTWTITVEMQGFATFTAQIAVGPNLPPPPALELKVLSLDQIDAQIEHLQAQPAAAPPEPSTAPPANAQPRQPANPPAQTASANPQQNEAASEGFLINGSENNGAASPFAQLAAFGNNRNAGHSLYNGGIGAIIDDSVLDARPYSLTGEDTPKPSFYQVTGLAALQGPLKIPHLLPRGGPNFFVGYQWTRHRDDETEPALVPDANERAGDFSGETNSAGQPVQIFNPATGLPFTGNVPISPQAQALLNLYPLPNVAGNSRFNYQAPVITTTHQDALQSRFDRTIGHRDQLNGLFAFLSTRTSTPNLFGFVDRSNILGLNTSANWNHRFQRRPLFLTTGFRFSRFSTRITPYWEDRENVSGDAGITGNNQDPMNWGPPSLMFSSGILPLSDGNAAFNRNQTSSASVSLLWFRARHDITFGGDFRWQEFNYLSQQNPRGTFTFTGAATSSVQNGVPVGGSDFADFLLGIPDTSAIAYGNADKYFRQSVSDAFIADDWRVGPQLTVSAGVRWEYGAPITELYGRLVNLDVTPGFAAAAPVLASNPVGPLTGQDYPTSLIRPDHHDVAPRLGIAWRPISGSSLVVRAGYGIYYDTSVYQTLALEMAQQAPLSKSLSVQNSAACPLTLASGFNPCSAVTQDVFGVDPNFRVGYAQTWQLAVQRELPGAMQLTVTYLGIKGTRGPQEFLPNTYPTGATNPCPACPAGFAYFTSDGNSTREAGQVQLRRRLHNGLTATLQYTYSKSIDDDSLLGGQGATITTPSAVTPSQFNQPMQASLSTTQGAPAIAQNWLDLPAERGLSTFDQRHLLNAQLQYTTGMGIGGGTLMTGWKGRLLKEWTFLSQIVYGSGLPETPIYLAAVPGTGVTGTIRPDATGAPIYLTAPGLFLNSTAYTAPLPGQWGDAGRDSIIGPAQFNLNGSIGRTFRLEGRFNLDLRIDATNLLNHVTYTAYNTVINSSLFGSPAAANPMRSMQATLRLRF